MKTKLALIALVIFIGCAPNMTSYKQLSASDPEKLIALSDSLLAIDSFKNDSNFVNIIVQAHINEAQKKVAEEKFDEALKSTQSALKLNPKHKMARYYNLLAEGHVNYKHGNVWKLWDAIGLYTKASDLYPENGEPYYWMARSFEKKDEQDYESIIEAYTLALEKLEEGSLKADAEERLARVKEEKTTFENFWK